eukprot:363973-Chlamydomonas_euryale.AAC.16
MQRVFGQAHRANALRAHAPLVEPAVSALRSYACCRQPVAPPACLHMLQHFFQPLIRWLYKIAAAVHATVCLPGSSEFMPL